MLCAKSESSPLRRISMIEIRPKGAIFMPTPKPKQGFMIKASPSSFDFIDNIKLIYRKDTHFAL